MMNNKTVVKVKKRLLVIVSLLALAGFGLWKLNKDFLLFWDSNSINITAEQPLQKEKVKIEFGIGANTINRKTHSDLFKNREKYIILFDGTKKENLINEYGENDFLITYDNLYYAGFRHFKFNRRHQHNYHFNFYKKSGQLFVKVVIKGKDALMLEQPMNKISTAEKSANLWLKIEAPLQGIKPKRD